LLRWPVGPLAVGWRSEQPRSDAPNAGNGTTRRPRLERGSGFADRSVGAPDGGSSLGSGGRGRWRSIVSMSGSGSVGLEGGGGSRLFRRRRLTGLLRKTAMAPRVTRRLWRPTRWNFRRKFSKTGTRRWPCHGPPWSANSRGWYGFQRLILEQPGRHEASVMDQVLFSSPLATRACGRSAGTGVTDRSRHPAVCSLQSS
jgi:hypothetical protein